ncbi:hypothetical protein THARTR1_00107 [Trichoderma harzianum]|uniref:Uncharacterized protein n=1 Tax=Trichoderma harzianum TaxID=5544 RepID=A0A2K0UQN5_TRIHA|nr:hypothetical protein THARTR1_00107 [Trichoderma harzianum]
MAPSTKDMRRADLSECCDSPALRGAIGWGEPVVKGEVTDFSSTMSSTLPMAAMFMRNKFVGWIAVVFSIQTWLGESEDSKKSNGTPGYFSVGMSVMALAVTYLPMFIPPPGAKTATPPPQPLQ